MALNQLQHTTLSEKWNKSHWPCVDVGLPTSLLGGHWGSWPRGSCTISFCPSSKTLVFHHSPPHRHVKFRFFAFGGLLPLNIFRQRITLCVSLYALCKRLGWCHLLTEDAASPWKFLGCGQSSFASRQFPRFWSLDPCLAICKYGTLSVQRGYKHICRPPTGATIVSEHTCVCYEMDTSLPVVQRRAQATSLAMMQSMTSMPELFATLKFRPFSSLGGCWGGWQAAR